MTTPVRRRARAGAVLLASLAGLGGWWVLHARGASADVVCTYFPIDQHVEFPIGMGQRVTVVRGTGDQILVDTRTCTAADSTPATLSNTKEVDVTGDTGDETLVLDLSGGPFAPSAVGGTLQFDVSLGGSAGDTVSVLGSNDTEHGDHLGVVANGVDLDADGSADVTIIGVKKVELHGGPGKDTFTLASTPDFAVTTFGDADDTTSYAGHTNSITVTLDGNANDGEAGEDDDVRTENVIGGSGVDVLTGDDGPNSLTGGPDSDILNGGNGSDTLQGGPGNDALNGGDDNDTLTGGPGNDILNGDAGDDTFDEGADASGGDFILGGAGSDTTFYGGRTNAATVTLDSVANDGEAGEGDDVRTENVTGGSGDDHFTGDNLANVFHGGPGDDTFHALAAGDGGDTFAGDEGLHDVTTYALRATPVTVTLDGASNDGGAGEKDNVQTEDVTGGSGNDHFTGDEKPNVFHGGPGDDTFHAPASDGGGDTFAGDDGDHDTTTYDERATAVTVTLDGAGNDGAAGENDNVQTEYVTGGSGDDHFTGDEKPNVFHGGPGDDTFHALAAGDGGDAYLGEAGTGDTTTYEARSARVVVTLDLLANDGGPGENDFVVTENVTGGAGGDALTGDLGDNVLIGGGGDDVIVGGPGNDTLSGGDGNDVFVEGGAANGADRITGDAGTDLTSYAARSAPLTVRLDGLANDGESDEGDAVDTENVTGGFSNDTITGDDAPNVLTGGTGNDTLNGGGGNDVLNGGDGNDTLSGGAGDDTLAGDAGTDTADYSASPAAVTVNLLLHTATGEGTDTLSGVENVTGSSSGDTITGDDTANILSGGAGDDTLVGRLGNDVLDGGLGSDTVGYEDAQSAVTVDLRAGTALGDGVDTLTLVENAVGSPYADRLVGSPLPNRLSGRGGNDVIIGAEGDDLLFGDSDDDTFDEGAGPNGADLIDGGDGENDTTSYASRTAPVRVSLDRAANDGEAGERDNVQTENVVGGSGDDELTGDLAKNTLEGGPGDDTLAGGEGDDTERGGAGNDLFDEGPAANGADTLVGGDGTDTVSYERRSADLVVDLSAAGGDGEHDEHDDVSAENARGGSGTDVLTGNDQDNVLLGGAGADRLAGGRGNDILNGQGGGDTLLGGEGDDSLDGGSEPAEPVHDVASYEGESGVVADLSLSPGRAVTPAGTDTLLNIEDLTGSAFTDTLIGSAGMNTLRGLGEDDTLRGRGGDDVLDGGEDTDLADYSSGSPRRVCVDLQRQPGVAASGDDVGRDTLEGIEDVTGTPASDVIIGDAGRNRLDGGPGDDVVWGRSGRDVIEGGAATDTLDFAGPTVDVSHATCTGVSGHAAATPAVDVDLSTSPGTARLHDPEGDVVTVGGIEDVVGSGQADVIVGSAAGNRLVGGAGNDQLRGGPGDDVLDGGPGVDSADWSTAAAGVAANLMTGRATGEGTDELAGIENLVGSAHADTLTGDTGANVLLGGPGDDVLSGGPGNDTLNGGPGIDTADYSSAPSGVTVLLEWPYFSAQDTRGAGRDTIPLNTVENLVGSPFADRLVGSSVDNTIVGGAGNDRLEGGGGDDRLDGGEGRDLLDGQGGNDVELGGADDDQFLQDPVANGTDDLEGGPGTDAVNYSRRTAQVVVTLDGVPNDGSGEGDEVAADVETVSAGAGADVLACGSRPCSLFGGAGDDTLTGGPGNDTLEGSDGNDRLSGGGGDDSESGGAGDDTFGQGGAANGADGMSGGPGSDMVDYGARQQAVRVSLDGSADDGEPGEGDNVLPDVENVNGGNGADTLLGSDGGNRLSGGNGADTLSGGGGDDVLSGAGGDDTIVGGDGADQLLGDAGNDDLFSRDGVADTVDGGPGSDRARVDGDNKDVVVNVEQLLP